MTQFFLRRRNLLSRFVAKYSSASHEPLQPIEALERRCLCSVDVHAAALQSPLFTVGNTWTYAYTANGSTGTFVRTVIGNTTLSNGLQQWEIDDTTSLANVVDKDYYGLDAAGDLVSYGDSSSDTGTSIASSNSYSPPLETLPALMAASTPYNFTAPDTSTFTTASGVTTTSTSTKSTTVTLASDMPSDRVVSGTTYSVYQVTTVNDENAGSTTVEYDSPQYGLVELDTSGGVNSTITLTNFTGKADHLAFGQPPVNVGVGKMMKQVTVEVRDTSDALDTSVTGSITLTLTPVGAASGQLMGAVNQSITDGVATFTGLSIDKPGSYVLTATDNIGRAISSTAFDVAAGNLVFKRIPKEGLAGTALNPAIEVELKSFDGKLITDSPSNVTISITGENASNPITGNTAAQANGNAIFSSLKLAKPGMYTLTATDDQGDTAATSDPIKIDGYHLAFRKEPGKTGVGGRIVYLVALEDPKNHIVTADNTDGVQFSLNTIEGGANAALANVADTIYRGVAFNEYSPFAAVNSPGTYTLTATLLDTSNNGMPTPYIGVTDPITSKEFTVVADHLAFVKGPSNTYTNTTLIYEVELKDYKNHTVTTNADQLTFSLAPLAGETTAVLAGGTDQLLAGVATNSGTIPLSISGPGKFKLTVVDVPPDVTDPVAMQVTSKEFTIRVARGS